LHLETGKTVEYLSQKGAQLTHKLTLPWGILTAAAGPLRFFLREDREAGGGAFLVFLSSSFGGPGETGNPKNLMREV
jgi:hypothetical protein